MKTKSNFPFELKKKELENQIKLLKLQEKRNKEHKKCERYVTSVIYKKLEKCERSIMRPALPSNPLFIQAKHVCLNGFILRIRTRKEYFELEDKINLKSVKKKNSHKFQECFKKNSHQFHESFKKNSHKFNDFHEIFEFLENSYVFPSYPHRLMWFDHFFNQYELMRTIKYSNIAPDLVLSHIDFEELCFSAQIKEITFLYTSATLKDLKTIELFVRRMSNFEEREIHISKDILGAWQIISNLK